MGVTKLDVILIIQCFLLKNIIKFVKYGIKYNRYFTTSISSFQSYQIYHPKTLDDILPLLIPPPLELAFLSLRCYFNDYENDTSNINSR